MASHKHFAYLLFGSNIDPIDNMRHSLLELCHYGIIKRISRVWQTPAFGSQGPDFINLAVELVTPLTLNALKRAAIPKIESMLGRLRTLDKNSPRTIDIDAIVFDGKIIDPSLWYRVHTAVTIGELLPDLPKPNSIECLSAVAAQLTKEHPIVELLDVLPTRK